MNTTTESPVVDPKNVNFAANHDGVLNSALHRIDLVAIAVALLGLCFLAVTVLVLAVIDLAKFVAAHWSVATDRYLLIILAVAIVWVAVRWKHTSLN